MMWTEAQTEELRVLLAEGKTAGQAANVLGVSRGAAMGRAHRQGFEMNAPNTGGWGEERMKRVRAARKEKAKAKRRNPFLFKASQPKPPRPVAQRPSAAAPSLGLTLLQINDNDCHFIAGDDHLYCGHPVEVKHLDDGEEARPESYCPGHMRIMYQPVRARAV